jgi:riboflavin kinase / FMN adenylyltransferase
MEVYRDIAAVPRAPEGRALAVGTFDGVHLGHRRVIEGALAWGRDRGVPVAVVTFDPHPLQVLAPGEHPPILTPTPLKTELIRALGIDELVVLAFTQEFARLEPEQFRDDVLWDALQARYVSVGANFRFGRRARGDAELLARREELETSVVPLVQKGDAPVSSTRIRSLISAGDVARAAELLGAPFAIEGVVVRGSERGRRLGVPTANVEPPREVLLPGAGVYAGAAQGLPAAINVGTRPTFEPDGETLLEAHLVGFDGDLYGQRLRVSFLERLRDELRFDSADELVEQMHKDVERVQTIVATSG